MNETTKNVNETLAETAEEIVTRSSNGSLKKFGIVGGLVALGVAGYFVVKKIKNNKVAVVDDDAICVDVEDVDFLDEDITSEKN